MELTPQQVKDIVLGLRDRGMDVVLRDVSFVVLASVYGDESLAFRAIFGGSPDVDEESYLALPKLLEVRKAVLAAQPERPAESSGDAVSFDDLKEGLIADMRALEELRDLKDDEGRSALDAKELATVVARIADIRVKLTEKFNTTERVVEQRVVVNQKFNSVCSWCGHEIAIGPQNKPESELF